MRKIPKNRRPTTPGELIYEEFMEPQQLTQAELAKKAGIPSNRLNQILSGKKPVTPEIAKRLEKVLGVSKKTWMNMQKAVDVWDAQKQQTGTSDA